MASIIQPNFKQRRSSRYQRRVAPKETRAKTEIPSWIAWCFVGVLFLLALYLSPSTNQLVQDIAMHTADIEVVGGDTVRNNGQIFRLVGFNTPEAGFNAQCSGEWALAKKATARLQQLLAGGVANLERVACACNPGTEGTQQCNHGRLCGRLTRWVVGTFVRF